MDAYREAARIIDVPQVGVDLKHLYDFGDEYMSRLTESFSFRLLQSLGRFRGDEGAGTASAAVEELIREEADYKRARGYAAVAPDDPQGNRRLVYRHNVLKKYISSDLYIKLDKKQDGKTVRQIYYSIAAGIAMVLSLIHI